MEVLNYPLTNYVEIAKELCKAINGVPYENHYTAENKVGKALVEFFDYGQFSIMLSQYEVFTNVKIGRSYSSLKNHLAFDFLLKGYSDSFQNQVSQRVNQMHFGCYISTPSTESVCVYRPSNKYDLFSILIQKSWLESFIGKPLPEILQKPNEPLFIHIPLGFSLISSLMGLVQSEPQSFLRKPYLYSKSLEAVTSMVESLLLTEKKYEQHPFPPSELETVYQMVEWLENNPEANPSVQELSQQFGLNRNKLQFIFKSIFGQTVGEYVRFLKMNKAHELILQNLPIAEVGHGLGYSNLSHFSKAFRKVHGFNPSEALKKR